MATSKFFQSAATKCKEREFIIGELLPISILVLSVFKGAMRVMFKFSLPQRIVPKKFALTTLWSVLLFLGSPTSHADLIDDEVLFQGCHLAPIFPTDCTGFPFFLEQTSVVTADASDSFQFGVMNTNVQAESILVTLTTGAAQDSAPFFNGTLIRNMDWFGESGFITGFTLSNNTMANFTNEHVQIFENGHAVAINVGILGIGPGSVTINLITDNTPVPESITIDIRPGSFPNSINLVK